ncbi:MAG: DUF4827 domain-containing protein [Bacteroidaceae bacterium]|nr:DUF4827 domain-containing protein [Bacteroidaceae bacterium]
MKSKWILMALLPLFAILFGACDDEKTYSDMKNAERGAVKSFIKEQGINVISFKDFIAQDSVTDIENNEYVLIDDVYMQIVRNPRNLDNARQMRDGETLNILARFVEYNIQSGDTIIGNLYDSDNPEVMRITYDSGSYSGTFTAGYMSSYYGNAVPTGWLTPFPYIWLTRSAKNIAKVNLIVPHTKGTSTAASYVYPCYYQITFQPDSNFQP